LQLGHFKDNEATVFKGVACIFSFYIL